MVAVQMPMCTTWLCRSSSLTSRSCWIGLDGKEKRRSGDADRRKRKGDAGRKKRRGDVGRRKKDVVERNKRED